MDFDWGDAFHVHSFEYEVEDGGDVKTIHLREVPAGEFITNRTDVLLPLKKGETQRQVNIEDAQKVRYDNAAKSICTASGELVFNTGAEVKAKVPAKLFALITDWMDEINQKEQPEEDEEDEAGNSQG